MNNNNNLRNKKDSDRTAEYKKRYQKEENSEALQNLRKHHAQDN